MGYKLKKMIRKVRGNKNSNLVAIPTYVKIKLDIDEGDLIEYKETEDGRFYIEKVDK